MIRLLSFDYVVMYEGRLSVIFTLSPILTNDAIMDPLLHGSFRSSSTRVYAGVGNNVGMMALICPIITNSFRHRTVIHAGSGFRVTDNIPVETTSKKNLLLPNLMLCNCEDTVRTF